MVRTLTKIAAFAATICIAILVAGAGAFASDDSHASGPVIELPADADKCIRPTEFMRKSHMDLLLHKRDQTTREGIRTQDASLQGCVDCHSKKDADGTPIPVNAEGQFCATCHEYTSVKLDCFECHRTTPDTIDSTAAIPAIPAHTDLFAKNSTQIQQLRNYLKEAN